MNGAALLLLLFAIVAVAAASHRYNDSATTTRYRFEHNATTQHYRLDRNATTSPTMSIRGQDDNEDNSTASSVHDDMPDDLQNSFSAAVDMYLGASSVLYGLIGQSSPRAVSGQCHSQLLATYAGIHRRDVWAMKMLDASATAQPGFVWGNNFWLGSRKQCESVQMRKHITLSPRFRRNMKPNLVDERPPFDVDFRMVHARHSSPWQVEVEFLLSANILHLGVCVPMSCNNSDIHQLAQSYLDSNLMEPQNLFVHQADVVQVKDLVLSDGFYEKTSLRIVGGFLLFTVCMVTLASLYEPSARRVATKTAAPTATNATQEEGGRSEQPTDRHQAASTVERFVACFSLRTNIKSVLSTDAPPSALPTINAFKSIGCFLILNFHLAWYSYYAISNRAEVFVLGEQLQWQWLSTSPLIVDIFFSISGLLLAYNFLGNEKKVAEIRANSMWGNVRLFGKQLLHRYLRLTPLYLVVVGGTEIATAYLAEKSPFWINDRIDLQCQQHWWRNVLYIQNFFEVEEMCLNWTWSLACEMQFFLLSSALLFAYVKYPRVTQRVFIALGIAFTAVVATISWQLKFTPAYDVLHDLGTELYTVPWVRVLPYLIGVAVGWYLHVSAGQALPLRPQTINLGWTLSCTVMVISHMVTYMRNISYLIGVPMIVAVRLLYGGAACWMIVASVKGHGGWFTHVMNRPVFVHLNKLSYGIYLLNPIVVLVIYGLGDHSTAIEPIVQVTTGVGIMVIVYLMSFVCSLLFEMPYTKLSAEILRGRKQKML